MIYRAQMGLKSRMEKVASLPPRGVESARTPQIRDENPSRLLGKELQLTGHPHLRIMESENQAEQIRYLQSYIPNQTSDRREVLHRRRT